MMLTNTRYEKEFAAIKAVNTDHNLPIKLLCDIAGVARSSYYKWLNRKGSQREKENEILLKEIEKLHHEVGGIYGYRRITMNLNHRLNKQYNYKRIYRLMKVAGIQSVIRKKRKRYIASQAIYKVDNLLNREFNASSKNQKWVTDVTQFKYGNGKVGYLSAIMDLYDNSIISHHLSHYNNNALVLDTFSKAIRLYPDAKPLVHSDRGHQYTSHSFKRLIKEQNMTHSMSRPGKCIDNGPIEGFWGILKSEKYYLNDYSTYESLDHDINEFIYFYNHKRLQKRLSELSPIEYRASSA